MAAWIIGAVLAAFGGICTVWILFGFFLPVRRGAAAVLFCRGDPKEDALIHRYLWLYHGGLIHCPLLLVDCGLTETDRNRLVRYPVCLCTPGELEMKLEQEREHLG